MPPAMTDNPLTEEYLHRLHEDEQRLVEFLADGKAKDYAKYKEVVGQIKGIRDSKRQLHDTIKMYMSAENIDA